MGECCRGMSKGVVGLIGAMFCALSILFLVMGGFLIANTKQWDKFDLTKSGILLVGAAIVIAIGLFWFLAGLAGICTTCAKDSKVLPAAFGLLLLILVVLNLSVCTLIFVGKGEIESGLDVAMKEMVANYTMHPKEDSNNTTHNVNENDGVDAFQKYLKCCGVDGPSDWTNSSIAATWVKETNGTLVVPWSCGNNITDSRLPVPIELAHSEGCHSGMLNVIKHTIWWVGGTVIFFSVLLVLGFVGSCYLMCSKRELPYFTLN